MRYILVLVSCFGLLALVLGQIAPAELSDEKTQLKSFANVTSRECTQPGKVCTCVDLWQSDCVCDGSDDLAWSIGKRKCGNCRDVCDEVWHHSLRLADYNVTCNVPLITQYSVQMFVRSMSTWSAEALMSFKIVLEFMRDAVRLDVFYTGSISDDGTVSSAGGPLEVAGDIFQLCAMRYYPHYSRYMPFVYCMSKTRSFIPYNAWNCSRAHLMDYKLLNRCATIGEGMDMLKQSVQLSLDYRVSEPLPVLVMDGRPFRASYSRSPESFLYALCYIFKNPSKPFPWWVFGFMGAIVLALLVVLFVVKQWTSENITDILRSIFLFESHGQEGDGVHDFYDEDFFRMLAEVHEGRAENAEQEGDAAAADNDAAAAQEQDNAAANSSDEDEEGASGLEPSENEDQVQLLSSSRRDDENESDD